MAESRRTLLRHEWLQEKLVALGVNEGVTVERVLGFTKVEENDLVTFLKGDAFGMDREVRDRIRFHLLRDGAKSELVEQFCSSRTAHVEVVGITLDANSEQAKQLARHEQEERDRIAREESDKVDAVNTQRTEAEAAAERYRLETEARRDALLAKEDAEMPEAEEVERAQREAQEEQDRVAQKERDAQAERDRIAQEERDAETERERLAQIERDAQAERDRLAQIEIDAEIERNRLALEEDARVAQLELDAQAERDRIAQEERDAETEREHLAQIERDRIQRLANDQDEREERYREALAARPARTIEEDGVDEATDEPDEVELETERLERDGAEFPVDPPAEVPGVGVRAGGMFDFVIPQLPSVGNRSASEPEAERNGAEVEKAEKPQNLGPVFFERERFRRRRRHDIVEEPVVEAVAPEPVVEAVAPETVVEAVAPEPVVEAVAPEPVVEAVAPEPVVEAVAPEPVVEAVAPEPVVEAVAPEPVVEAVAPTSPAEGSKSSEYFMVDPENLGPILGELLFEIATDHGISPHGVATVFHDPSHWKRMSIDHAAIVLAAASVREVVDTDSREKRIDPEFIELRIAQLREFRTVRYLKAHHLDVDESTPNGSLNGSTADVILERPFFDAHPKLLERLADRLGEHPDLVVAALTNDYDNCGWMPAMGIYDKLADILNPEQAAYRIQLWTASKRPSREDLTAVIARRLSRENSKIEAVVFHGDPELPDVVGTLSQYSQLGLNPRYLRAEVAYWRHRSIDNGWIDTGLDDFAGIDLTEPDALSPLVANLSFLESAPVI